MDLEEACGVDGMSHCQYPSVAIAGVPHSKKQGHAHDYRGAGAQSQKRAVHACTQALITQYVD